MANIDIIGWIPIELLTVENLQEVPIWECDENENVRPTQLKVVPVSDGVKVYIAYTEFILADNSIMYGFCCPSEYPWLEQMGPAIISDRGLWDICSEDEKNIRPKRDSQIYPLEFECQVECQGEKIKHTIYED